MWFFMSCGSGCEEVGSLGIRSRGSRMFVLASYWTGSVFKCWVGGRESHGWGSTRQPHSAKSESGDAVLTC